MQAVATEVVTWRDLFVCLSVWLTSDSYKTAELGQIRVGPRNYVLDEGAHWRHQAKTME